MASVLTLEYMSSMTMLTFTLRLLFPTSTTFQINSTSFPEGVIFCKIKALRGYSHHFLTTKAGGCYKSFFIHPKKGSASKQGIILILRVWKYRFNHPIFGGFYSFFYVHITDSLPNTYSQLGQILRSIGSVGHESASALSASSTASSPNFWRASATSSS